MGKVTNMWKLSNILLNNRSKKKNHRQIRKQKHNIPKLMECSERSVESETYSSNTIINNLTVYLKELEKESKLNPKLKEERK